MRELIRASGIAVLTAGLIWPAGAQTNIPDRWQKYGLSGSAMSGLRPLQADCDLTHPEGCRFEGGNRFLHIRWQPVPGERAAFFIRDRELAAARSLYQSQKTPYPGQITTLRQCDKELIPFDRSIMSSAGATPIFIGGASQRRIFGACTKGEVFFAGFQTGVYSADGYLRLTGFKKFEAATPWGRQADEMERWARELIR